MKELELKTKEVSVENIEKIKAIFPGCIVESKSDSGEVILSIDFDQLRQELTDSIIEGGQERYQLNWPGKKESLLAANSPIGMTLRPCRNESVAFDNTKNIFIEGDNLDALKLLQESFLEGVKLIYIDPPYNTGSDFIYSDNFSQTSNDFFQKSLQEDSFGNRLIANTESNGRFHSDWLSMMYSRLKLSRNLLQDDGVIFVSIDDNEVANLLKLMNEVFGEDNFVANIIWRKKYGVQNDAKHFSTSHEYIVCYAKDKSIFRPKLLERSEEQNNRYKNPDNDARGPWKPENLTVGRVTAKDIYPITTPSGRVVSPPEGRSWVVSEEKYRVLLADNRIWFGESGGNVPAVKRFLSEVKQGITPATFWDYDEVGHTDGSNKALKALFGNKQYFDYPKPVDLIKRIIKISTTDGIILDFFSGSGTTGHAVMEMNAEDGGDRRFILVQLPEDCPPKSEALKSGFKTIADITKERLKLSGIKVKSELGSLVNSELDIGFRVLKVDTSNFNETYQNPDAIDQDLLSSHVDNILRDRSGEDLLFQVLLSWGVDLSLPIEKKNINGKDLYVVDGNALVACFDQNGGVDEDLIRSISEICPLRVVFRDAGFKNDAMKINVEQIFKTLSPNTEIKTI